MPDHQQFESGDKVFRRYAPGKRGYITGRKLEKAEEIYYQVDFPDAKEYVPHYELESVEDDLDVFEIIEQKSFGNVSDLRRNFSHIQISGNLSSLIYSLDVTGTDFLPYQFKPVLTFLESPSRGLLIADEVGLGKTIEAGLIWTELRARYDCRRLLVVCPAMLRDKWRDELRDRFGVDTTTMNAVELLDELKRPRTRVFDGKGIICSMQGIRIPSDQKKERDPLNPRSRLAQFLDEQSDNPDPVVDLVVIDEAHHMRNSSSQTARLGRMLQSVSGNVLLLSATPINLKSEDLFNLLKIVDQDLFRDQEFFGHVLRANEPLVRARELVFDSNASASRVRKCLVQARDSGRGVLANNSKLKKLIETVDSHQGVLTVADRVELANTIDRVNFLRHAVNRTRKRDVVERRVVRKPTHQTVKLDPVERKLYDDVTRAVRDYAEQREINDGFLLASPQRQVSSCMYAAVKSWKDRAHQADNRSIEDGIYEDMGKEVDSAKDVSPLIAHLISTVLPSVNLSQLRQVDSKFEQLYLVVHAYLKDYPDKKIVVFSYFRGTLHYLAERLSEKGVANQILVGGLKEPKQDAIHRFRDTPETKVLLSSEVASEGVDLQFCQALVNYDLPWNPMKIEQRVGRLDRIGQKSDTINIYNFFHADTIDERICRRLFERLEIFTRALGGMEAVLGEKITALTNDLIRHHLTPDEEKERIDQTAQAVANNRKQEEHLEKEASNLIAHGDYILKKVKTAHNLKKRITEDDLIVYVKDYLDKHAAGHEFRRIDHREGVFNIKLPAKTAAELQNFIEAKNLREKTGLAMGHQVRCEFVNKTNIVSAHEQINQFHPLIRFISTKVGDENFFPVVAVKISSKTTDIDQGLPVGQYAFVADKWTFTGLREEADMRIRVVHMTEGVALDAENSWQLLNVARLSGADWPEYAAEVDRAKLKDNIFDCRIHLDKQFDAEKNDKQAENEDRINVQIDSAKNRRDRQIGALHSVLDKYLSENNARMIPATRGRIKNLTESFEVQFEKLKNRVDIQASKAQFCCGVLLLK